MRLFRAHEMQVQMLEEFEQLLDDPLSGSLETILTNRVLGRRLLIIGMSANIDVAARQEALSR